MGEFLGLSPKVRDIQALGTETTTATTFWAADGRILYDSSEDGQITIDGELRGDFTPLETKGIAILIKNPDIPVPRSEFESEVHNSTSPYDTGKTTRLLQNICGKLGPELGDMDTGAILTRYKLGTRIVKSLVTPYVDALNTYPQHSSKDRSLVTVPSMSIAVVDGKAIELAPVLFSIFDEMLANPGKIVSLRDCSSKDYSANDTFTRLRRRLKQALGSRGDDIITHVWGEGYMINQP